MGSANQNWRRVAVALASVAAAGAARAADSAAPSPVAAADPLSAGSLLQVTLGLGVVLLFIVVGAWLLRRVGAVGGPAAGALKVLGAVSMGQRERLVLVQVGETQLVVGVAPGNIRTLHVLDKPIDIASHTGPGKSGRPEKASFAARLEAALNERIRS